MVLPSTWPSSVRCELSVVLYRFSVNSQLHHGSFGIRIVYMTETEILVVEGCAPVIRRAIKELYESWGSYSNGKGPYRLNVLFNQLMEPAWQSFVRSLPPQSITRRLCRSIILHVDSDGVTFQSLERVVQELCRTMDACTAIDESNGVRTLATLDSVRTLLQLCDAKQPQRLNIRGLRRSKASCAMLCRFCGHYTELYEARAVSKTDEELDARLSGQFCKKHKKRNKKGTQNKAYIAASRRIDRFNEVLRKLKRQVEPHMYRKHQNGTDLSDFYSLVIAEIAPVKDENEPITWPQGVTVTTRDADFKPWEYWDTRLLRDTACWIVESGITERLMEIITRLRSGYPHAEIARQLRISRQQLWGILRSKRFKAIPLSYRFDRKKH